VDLRLLIGLSVTTDADTQRIIQAQLLDVRAWHLEDRHTQIAAFHRRRPVVKVNGALPGLYDPVAGIFEPNQATVYDTNGIARLALPGMVAFELELYDAHFAILTGKPGAGSSLRPGAAELLENTVSEGIARACHPA
jgi:hypothetical protein